MGFSHHSVPSLSNTATRSSTGTSDTVRSTNSTIPRLAAPSFQLAKAVMASKQIASNPTAHHSKRMNQRRDWQRRVLSARTEDLGAAEAQGSGPNPRNRPGPEVRGPHAARADRDPDGVLAHLDRFARDLARRV